MSSRLPVTVSGPGFVGRSAELAALESALGASLEGEARFVLVSGEAGVGKTTLVNRFLGGLAAVRPGTEVVRGQCVPMAGAGLPYAPVAAVLRAVENRFGAEQVLAWAGGGAGALGVLLPDLGEPAEHAQLLRLQLFEAVARVLQGVARVAPLVVVLEDIHWADESSRTLLQFLARMLDDAAMLVVCTFRTDEVGRGHPLRPFLADLTRLPTTSRLEVRPLVRAEVAELLTNLGGRRPAPTLVDEVFRRSDGVPFYVEELAAVLHETDQHVPDSVRTALEGRIEALSAAALDTLQLAAVGGNRVDHELLLEAAGVDAERIEADLREAVDAQVLVVEGRDYAFRHALFNEVVYEDLLPGRRARLHARWAQALERRPELAGSAALHAVALHWSAAGDRERSFASAVAAARAGSVAHSETLAMYERVLQLWDQVPDTAAAGPLEEVLVTAAHVARDAGEYDRALDLVEQAEQACAPDDHERRIGCLLLRSQLLTDSLRAGARPLAAAARQLVERVTDDVVRARFLAELATYESNCGGDAVGLAEEAVEAAVRLGDQAAEADARTTWGTALVAEGRDDEGLGQLRQAASVGPVGLRAVLRNALNHSDALHLTGRYADAVTEALRGLAVAEEHGVVRSFGTYLVGNAAESLLALGEWDRAESMLIDAVALEPPQSNQTHLRLLQAWLATWRGDLDEADRILVESRPLIGDEQPMPQFVSQAIRVDGEHALAAGDPERAWSHLRVFVDHRDLYDAPREWPVLAMGAAAAATLDRGENADRRQLVRALLADARSCTVRPVWEALTLAELDDDLEGWRRAVEVMATAHAPVHLRPYAQLRMARHLTGPRDRSRLRELVDEAADGSRRLGSGLLTRWIADLAQRAGVAVAGAEAPGPLAVLTPREVEVLRLVADGRSNGEIGTALFISTKTVSVHVSNILAKLGVSGRGEAAAVAHRAGLLDEARA